MGAISNQSTNGLDLITRLPFRNTFNRAKHFVNMQIKWISFQMAGTLPKPQLRGYLRRFGIGMLTRATILASCFALAWKYLYAEPKKVKYAEYYKWVFRFSNLSISLQVFSIIITLIIFTGITTWKLKWRDCVKQDICSLVNHRGSIETIKKFQQMCIVVTV